MLLNIRQLSKQGELTSQNTANRIVKDSKLQYQTWPFTMRLTAYWKLNKNQQNNNQEERTMKHKKSENQSGLIIRFFRLPKKLDLKGKEVIVKIIKRIIRKSYKI